jgi:acyl-CoA thioester hydrolase
MDDVLTVVTRPADVRGARMLLAQEIRREDAILASAMVTVAVINGHGRARRLPEALATKLGLGGEDR